MLINTFLALLDLNFPNIKHVRAAVRKKTKKTNKPNKMRQEALQRPEQRAEDREKRGDGIEGRDGGAEDREDRERQRVYLLEVIDSFPECQPQLRLCLELAQTQLDQMRPA